VKGYLARILMLVSVAALVVGIGGPYWLVVDQPEKADVILVLAGETKTRPPLGLQLLSQGYAPRLVLDVPAEERIYQWKLSELAGKYLESLPASKATSVCPIHGLSTRDEARDALQCLQSLGVRNVLIVTSDYHSGRALAIFRHELPRMHFSVAGAHDELQFGRSWWKHRQWAKTFLGEITKFVWWQLVDRWR
jgi:uncharacterized SAM-binding protein YcdF (DUF218 family)